MAWLTYNITADSEALDNYCDRVVVVTESMANREDSNFRVPGVEGEFSYPDKLWEAGNVIMETFLKYTDQNGDVTHEDGAAGHVYENLSHLRRIFSKNGLVDLRRTAPDYGQTSMLVEAIQGPRDGSFPAHKIWVLKAPKPFWKGLTPVTLTSTTTDHTPAGDAPIDDMVVTFGGDGKVTIGSEWIEISGSSGSGIVVDVGKRTIIQSGQPRDRWFFAYSDRWLRLQGGVESDIIFEGAVTSLVYSPAWHGGGG